MDKKKLISLLSAAQERQMNSGRVYKEDYQAILDHLGLKSHIGQHDNPIHIGAIIQLEICKLALKEE